MDKWIVCLTAGTVVPANQEKCSSPSSGRSTVLLPKRALPFGAERARLSAKNPIAKAIQYSLRRWTAMIRFLDDGRICLSNNAAERALRGIAVAGTTGPSRAPTVAASALPPSIHSSQASERHGFMIVEDDPFADILPPLLPRLAALDQLTRVLYVGTLSGASAASSMNAAPARCAPAISKRLQASIGFLWRASSGRSSAQVPTVTSSCGGWTPSAG